MQTTPELTARVTRFGIPKITVAGNNPFVPSWLFLARAFPSVVTTNRILKEARLAEFGYSFYRSKKLRHRGREGRLDIPQGGGTNLTEAL